MHRHSITLALICAASALRAVPAAAMPRADPVVEWNRTLLTIVRTAGAQPPTIHPTRSFAIMHAAIYDAVASITGTDPPYAVRIPGVSRHVSKVAAIAAAAHRVLVTLYPSFQGMLDERLAEAMAEVPRGDRKRQQAIDVGHAVADAMLALRAHDGADAQPPPFVPGSDPGDYRLTPPNLRPAQFTHWAGVTPFVLDRADQFRVPPPPALTSDVYRDAFAEVDTLGIMDSATRSADQTIVGRFWNGAIQNYWNEIAQQAATSHHVTVGQSARLFAVLNLTLADSVVAFYDSKYAYRFWRPITAIRSADADGNPDTVADPAWLPLTTNTAPDPSYPGAHAVVSAAAAATLAAFFGDAGALTVTSEVLPDVTRRFTSFSAAADEATMSRVYAGNHFRFDLSTGTTLGDDVAAFVVASFQ